MKKESVLLKLVLIAGIIFFADSQLYAQSVVLTETEIKEDNSAVKILYATNRSVAVECYDLAVPPQIVVDFMGDVYSNMPEITPINKGVVKQMRVVKGTKPSTDLDASYYPVDFIIIDLKEAVRYDFDQGLTTSVLMISKPGMALPDAKAEKSEVAMVEPAMPEVVKKETAVIPAPVAVQAPAVVAPVVLEQKEYEQPEQITKTAVVEKTQSPTTESPRQRKPARKPAEKPEQKKTFTKKITGSIGSFFSFGKAKKKTPEQIQASQEAAEKKKASKTRRTRVPTPAQLKDQQEKQPKETPKTNKELRTRKPKEEANKNKSEAKVRKPRQRIEHNKKTDERSSPSKKSGKNPADQVAAAQKKVADAKAAVDNASAQVDAAVENIIKVQKDQDSVSERTGLIKAKNELAKNGYDESLKHMELAKSAANSVWMEYSSAKTKLASYLENNADPKIVADAQKAYDEKKAELEKVIKAADEAKKESDAKLGEYNKVQKENENLLNESQDPVKMVAAAKEDYAAKEKALKVKQDELSAAEKELETANIALKKFELEKADEEYKKSLDVIDSQLVTKMEAEQKKTDEGKRLVEEANKKKMEQDRKKEEEEQRYSDAILKQLEDEKQADAQAKQKKEAADKKAKEDAQIAAIKSLDATQKQKEETPAKRVRSKRGEPIPRSRKVTTPEKKPEKTDNGIRGEVLESAVELRNAGLEMQKKGDFDSAVKYYQQALMQDPNYATVHNDLGILYEQKGLEEKAKMEYLTTLKIDPHYIKAHSNLALLYEKEGDFKKAYYHWKQRVNLGREDDPWTLKAKQRMQMLENRK